MDLKSGIVLLMLLIGSLAAPKPEEDMSIFFNQMDPEARIVGGTQAPQSRHRHMVALTTGVSVRSLVCGGSLVSVRTVLTAAHCINAVFSGGALNSNLRVVVGTTYWNYGGTAYAIERNVTHSNYVSSTIKNDIGLLITTTDVALSNTVVVLPLNFDFQPGDVQARVAGWGRIAQGAALSAVLLELNVPTIDGQRCIEEVQAASAQWNMNAPPVEPHIEICTYHSPGYGACNGDSGSALVRIDIHEQIGIVSWGFACARGAPDMFVRVSAYRNWLLENIV
ncbi:chymotrypsin-2-like [Galleria mellonella]|uniref:Chymotrypsin-2-like n=1 Tax=Galleria mellonella TaxID=7137 RepID=A0ABM3MCW3_GALME|nr:chymotrypsin-2-like [Galleria mellonella]